MKRIISYTAEASSPMNTKCDGIKIIIDCKGEGEKEFSLAVNFNLSDLKGILKERNERNERIRAARKACFRDFT